MIEVLAPYYLIISSTAFLTLYISLSTVIHGSYSYVCYIRITALCLAMVATCTVHPRLHTIRRRLLKMILYTLFGYYIFSYIFLTFAYIFANAIDGIIFVDLLLGCLNLPAFFIIATRVKGYEEEHIALLTQNDLEPI